MSFGMITKYREKAKLCSMDTDSFIVSYIVHKIKGYL